MSTTKNIILDRTGVQRVGKYERGKVYRDVPAKEADRLIEVKGFRLATRADEPEARKATAKPADAAKDNQVEG